MKKIIIACILILFHFSAIAQAAEEIAYIEISGLRDSVLLRQSMIFIDSSNALLPDNISSGQWKQFDTYTTSRYVPWNWITKTAYLKFSLSNAADSARQLYFFPGISFSDICLYEMQADKKFTELPDSSKASGYEPFTLLAGEKKEFIAVLKFTKSRFNVLKPQIISAAYLSKYQKIQQYKNDPQMIVGYLLSGIILMMAFFSVANFLLSRKKEFLYNSIYTTCMFLLIFFSNYF